jgi:hypothetical protein
LKLILLIIIINYKIWFSFKSTKYSIYHIKKKVFKEEEEERRRRKSKEGEKYNINPEEGNG